jgi:hypothetical protein
MEMQLLRNRRALAVAAIAGQLTFTAGWVIGQAVQDDAYHPSRHDLSDLGALSADHPWVMLTGQLICGVTTIAFALGALRPALRGSRAGGVGSWLLALSGLGLDNLSDAFFRLDCRSADPCPAGQSWHSAIHTTVAGTVLLLLVVPFVLAAAFRRVPGWRSLALPSFGVGVSLVALMIGYGVLAGGAGPGYLIRAVALLAAGWVIALAVRVLRLPTQRPLTISAS